MEHTYIITGTVEINVETSAEEDFDYRVADLVEEVDIDLAEYLGPDLGEVVLSISPGFVLDSADDLVIRTIARTTAVLTRDQKDELLDFLSGQYSDGWGEGYEQHDRRIRGVFVSPWHEGQELSINRIN